MAHVDAHVTSGPKDSGTVVDSVDRSYLEDLIEDVEFDFVKYESPEIIARCIRSILEERIKMKLKSLRLLRCHPLEEVTRTREVLSNGFKPEDVDKLYFRARAARVDSIQVFWLCRIVLLL